MNDQEKELRMRLGAALRAARLSCKLTQDQLSERVMTDPETVSRFERGAALPSLMRLLALADALDVTVASLLGLASPRANDEWDQLQREVSQLAPVDQKLAVALVRTLVASRG